MTSWEEERKLRVGRGSGVDEEEKEEEMELEDRVGEEMKEGEEIAE